MHLKNMQGLLVCAIVAATFRASCAAENPMKGAVEHVKDHVDTFIRPEDQNNKGISNKLYVKFSPWVGDPLRKGSFFPLPRSLNGLTDKKDGTWRITEDALKTEQVFVVCRNNDYRLCLLVDHNNSTAGLRISVAVADMEKSQNAPLKPCQKKNIMFGTEIYSTTIFFVEQDVLEAGGRDMTEDTLTAPNGFYFDTGDNGLRHIPVQEEEIKRTPYNKQSCFAGMGRHYFYKLGPKSECRSIDGLFALYNEQSHNLAGVGFLSYGTNRMQVNGRPWFEVLPARLIKKIAPSSPACVPEYINKHGTHAVHIYVIDRPWRLTC